MHLSKTDSKRSLRIHVWVPELVLKRGGIQTFSRCLIEALADIVGSENVAVMAKNDPGTGREHGARSKEREVSGQWSMVSGQKSALSTSHLSAVASTKAEPLNGSTSSGWGRWPASLRTPIFFFGIIWRAIRERPDLVISTHLNFGIAGYAAKLLGGIRYWCVAHGVEAWDLRRHLARLGLRKSDLILAVSNYTRKRLLNEQPLKPDQVVVLPNTIIATAITPGPKPDFLMRRHALTVGDKVILTVARLAEPERYKGYDQILRALPMIRREIPDLKYVLVGEGEDRPRIEALVRSLNVCDAVVLAGGVPQKELPDYYNLCDVFAMPSKGEGFGIVYLEALVCGKPVLAGNNDGSSEPLQNGQLGVLVNADSIDEIASNLIRILGEQGAGGDSRGHGAGSEENAANSGQRLREETLRKFGFDAFRARLAALLGEAGSRE